MKKLYAALTIGIMVNAGNFVTKTPIFLTIVSITVCTIIAYVVMSNYNLK